MQRARHLAAATSGGGVRVPAVNSNSKMGNGAVTNRRRWLAILDAISGKLPSWRQELARNVNRIIAYFRTRIAVAFKAASWTRMSETGDSSLNKSWMRANSALSKECDATEQTEASF